ncbi:MAG: DivIVA domain-containing protein [Actinobacteria bacterium]|nr:DivIVA domain-containing protein [Actinomycetota bacterium]
MDVTPKELRNVEIAQQFRGYDMDVTDELLDRAASTIERLQNDLEQASRRGVPASSTPRDDEQPLTAPSGDADTISRTLLLAQRTADTTVAEAERTAADLVSDAEAKSKAMVEQAEQDAIDRAEAQRVAYADELRDLAGRVDTLKDDVNRLDQFADEYKSRIRGVLEADLAVLNERPGPDRPDEPIMNDVDVPSEDEIPTAASLLEAAEAEIDLVDDDEDDDFEEEPEEEFDVEASLGARSAVRIVSPEQAAKMGATGRSSRRGDNDDDRFLATLSDGREDDDEDSDATSRFGGVFKRPGN